jgi:hypothetical protein
LSLLQGLRATFTALVAVAFYLPMEKEWSFRVTATPWYLAQPLIVRLIAMQVRVGVCVVSARVQQRVWPPPSALSVEALHHLAATLD